MKKNAFTFIELLVAFMIIALLASILTSSIKRTRTYKAKYVFDSISTIGLKKAQEIYKDQDYIEYGIKYEIFDPNDVKAEQEKYVRNTAISAFIKIPEEGFENLSTEEQTTITTAIGRGWLFREEINARQERYKESQTNQ